MAKPDLITCNWHHYPRPPRAPSFIKSRKFPYYQHISLYTFLIFLLYVYTYTQGTLGCLLGFWPRGQNPAGATTNWDFLFILMASYQEVTSQNQSSEKPFAFIFVAFKRNDCFPVWFLLQSLGLLFLALFERTKTTIVPIVSSVLSGQRSATCDVIGSFQNGGRRTADQE